MPAFSFRWASQLFTRIVHTGVHPGLPFIEARRTKLLNLLSLPWIPCMFFFSVLNLLQERYLLSFLNILNVGLSLIVFLLHHQQRYLSARLFLIVASTVLYTVTGLLFQNGAEYFMLNILLTTILVYDNRFVILSLSVMTITAFLAIHFKLLGADAEPVPLLRVVLNVSCSLLFIILALNYYKQVHADYQQEKEEQKQALAVLNRDKEKLFSIIAHDIRGPLATLEILLDMFRKGEYPEKDMLEASEELFKKVNHLGGTIDNMLRWSMGQMKGIRVDPDHFAVAPLHREILQLFESGIKEKRLRIDHNIPEKVYLYADRDQVAVILRNLISNAIKFSHPGGNIQLSALVAEGMVSLFIQDEGVGIPPEKLGQLFSFQATPAYGTGGERGSGLGLLLSQEFAMLNGGNLHVQSASGKGTLFTVALPEGAHHRAGIPSTRGITAG